MKLKTIIDCLKLIFKESKEKTFCWFLNEKEPEKITCEKLILKSFDYVHTYKKLGCKPGDLVFIMLKHTPHLFYSFVGALLYGAIPSILAFPSEKQDPLRFWTSHRKLFEHSGGRVLITYKENLKNIQEHFSNGLRIKILTPEEIEVKEKPGSFPLISPQSTAFLQYSSGTTGLKKGVMLTHETVMEQVKSYGKTLGLNENSIIASWLPLYHDMGLLACFITPMLFI